VNDTDSDGNSSLLFALFLGHFELVKLLLHYGADVHARNDLRTTPLDLALSEDFKSMEIRSKGWYHLIRSYDMCYTVPFSVIKPSDSSILEIIRLIKRHGTDADYSKNILYYNSSLIKATYRGDLDRVKYFLAKYADVNASDSNGNTPLLIALFFGDLDIVKLLLNHDADVNAKNDFDKTAIEVALSEPFLEMRFPINDFLQESEHRNTMTHEPPYLERRPINRYSSVLKVIKLLLEYGADFIAAGSEVNMALIEASAKDRIEMVELLLGIGASIETKKNNGNTALIEAASNGHLTIVKLLVANGANINAENNNGSTAYIEAASKGHMEIAQILFDYGGAA
jgi:ankyrin repeat protein